MEDSSSHDNPRVASRCAAPRRPSRIDYQARVPEDVLIVVGAMVGRDQHAVLLPQDVGCQRCALHPDRIVPHRRQERDVRVVVRDDGRSALEEFDDLERRALPAVVDVGLVGDAQDEHAASPDCLAAIIQCRHDTFHDVVRHRGVDLAGQAR